jgi:hypothetical protein
MRLPRRSSKITSQAMTKFLKSLNVTKEQYRDWLGCKPSHPMLCYFKMNPDSNMRNWGSEVKERFGE